MRKKTIDDLGADDLAGAAIALRADFNVPLAGGRVAAPDRIDRTLPTIRRLSGAGARVVILSHLGRPGGRTDPRFTLQPVVRHLSEQLPVKPRFVPRVTGAPVTEAVGSLTDGSVLVLENTRFAPGETANDPALAAEWAFWADHFVTDAFGSVHRAHASTVGLPQAIAKKGGEAVAGFLVAEELATLGQLTNEPRRPFVAVLGGAKVSDKIGVIEALLASVDALVVGGAMANTFFCAMGLETGTSMVEREEVGTALRLMETAGAKILLPVDCVVARDLEAGAETRTADRGGVRPGEAIGDIGPITAALVAEVLSEAATVVWNGPVGVFEKEGFESGTFALARAAAEAADHGALVVIGGGESGAAARAAGVAERITHISSGGGACLDFLSGKTLPGVEVLSEHCAESSNPSRR